MTSEKLNPFTLSLLTNYEVLAIDRNAMGRRVVKVCGPAFTVPAPGSPPQANATAIFADLKLADRQCARDLWRQKDLGEFQDSGSAVGLCDGAVLLKIGTPCFER